MSEQLPPWPEPFDPKAQTLASYLGNVSELKYENARAEAALARLRVLEAAAMKAFTGWNAEPRGVGPNATVMTDLGQALAAIGPLPE